MHGIFFNFFYYLCVNLLIFVSRVTVSQFYIKDPFGPIAYFTYLVMIQKALAPKNCICPSLMVKSFQLGPFDG